MNHGIGINATTNGNGNGTYTTMGTTPSSDVLPTTPVVASPGLNWSMIIGFGVTLLTLFVVFFVISRGIKVGQQ